MPGMTWMWKCHWCFQDWSISISVHCTSCNHTRCSDCEVTPTPYAYAYAYHLTDMS
ncbi:hypothetical protein BHE90_017060 [Fusarium euwallaceae]|uniref:Uncharacterized protein n=3 Tax=Fusarium solani species complex TaxID=232080 RepID=A0A3M2RS92_9HYPO|nr:hypothetical protein CDV36_012305 [Fusarium kuroshium]RSM20973.1 hypothetical protein CDV31_000020 [Fusarium ambrosium]RTE68562.1 hypothetical protein BHE90_017060 [Fusarium euwallaceae]